MIRPLYPTPEMIQKAKLYEALFCNLYFPELKWFLSDFNITPKDGVNSLNMGFLVTAYDRAGSDYRNECKWKFGEIKDEELMLAIEEYFNITSQPFENEPLYTERDDLLEYLYKNDLGTQIRLGDKTLRSILTEFNIPLDSDPRNQTIGGMAESFKDFIRKLPTPYNRFWVALNLQASLRNWSNHTHDPRFAGIELHLYHRYALYTYIGVVYVCRKAWKDPECRRILEGRGLTIPERISKFDMPTQDVTIKVYSPDAPITRCRALVGKGKNRKKQDYNPDSNSLEYSFVVEFAQKYKQLSLNIFRGDHDDPFNKNLDYQSWFLSYDIYLPKTINCSSCGTINEPTSQLILNLFGTLDTKDESLRSILQEESSKIKDLLIASITRQTKEEREKYSTSLHMMLEDLKNSLSSEKKSVDQIRENVQETNTKVKDLINEIEQFNNQFRLLIEKEVKPISSFLSWTLPILFLIASGFGLLWTALYPLKSSLLWLKTETNLIIILTAILLIILPLISFSYFNPSKKWRYKLIQNSLAKWSCIIAIISFITSAYLILPYKREKDLINKYVFIDNSNNETTEAVIDLMKNYLKKHPKDEQAIVKLATYYIKYSEEVDSALHILEPIIEDYSKYKSGAITIAEAFYAKKNYLKVWDIFKNTDVFNDSIPEVARLKGIMLAVGNQGRQRDYSKGMKLLELAADKGDLDAMYWIGYIQSNPDMQPVFMIQERRDTICGFSNDYNIIHAIKNLRRASILPNASIELGNIFADLNMKDSAKYYYKKAIDITQSTNTEALFQIGKLLYEEGDTANSYMAKALMRNYPPAILYSALRANDHITAIEQYKLFNDSIKASKYPKKYRDNYRYINPIVFEYIAANRLGIFNGLDSAYNYLTASRPNCHFNIEFVKGVEAMTSKDSLNIEKSWEWMQKSADKGCLYAKMMCAFREARDIVRKKSRTKTETEFIGYMETLKEIGKEIPFANVLVSWIYRLKAHLNEDVLFFSDYYNRKAILHNHLAAYLVLNVNAHIYQEFINSLTINYDVCNDSIIPESPYIKIGKDSIKLIRSYYSSTQMGLRFSPKNVNKWGFISMAYDLDKMMEYFYYNNKEYPTENFNFWCDLAIANHDFQDECNFLFESHVKPIKAMRKNINIDGYFQFRNDPYVKKLIIAGLNDYVPHCHEEYRNILSYSISRMDNIFFQLLKDKFRNFPEKMEIINNSLNKPEPYKPHIVIYGYTLFLPEKDEEELLKECYSSFSPYHEKELIDSINKRFFKGVEFIE